MLSSTPARRRRYPSLTSLIDVIFLLLLFFMLSSTFSKYNEVKVSASAAGAGSSKNKPELFISLGNDSWKINGELATTDSAPTIIAKFKSESTAKAVVRVTSQVTSQILVDALEILNREKVEVTLVR